MNDERPLIVASTSILGDVVSSLVGDVADVSTIMPPGADPHEFQASAQQAQLISRADLVVANGAGFEEGLGDLVESAGRDGVQVHEAVSAAGDAGGTSADPHFFTDPVRMAQAARAILDAVLAVLAETDRAAARATGDDYLAQLASLDTEIDSILSVVPQDERVLVTNHDVFGAFADRYGFRVVGTVIPGSTTAHAPSGGDLAALVEIIEQEGVRAIFADTSGRHDLAQTLAQEVSGGVAVVDLYSESLGPPGSGADTYIGMMRTNAQRIADALA